MDDSVPKFPADGPVSKVARKPITLSVFSFSLSKGRLQVIIF